MNILKFVITLTLIIAILVNVTGEGYLSSMALRQEDALRPPASKGAKVPLFLFDNESSHGGSSFQQVLAVGNHIVETGSTAMPLPPVKSARLTSREITLVNTFLRDLLKQNRQQKNLAASQDRILKQLRGMLHLSEGVTLEIRNHNILLANLRLAAIVDLVINSNPDSSAGKREEVLVELLKEGGLFYQFYEAMLSAYDSVLHDMGNPFEFKRQPAITSNFDEFLTSIGFSNGFEILKKLNLDEMFFFMLALLAEWTDNEKKAEEIRFEGITSIDVKKTVSIIKKHPPVNVEEFKKMLPIKFAHKNGVLTISANEQAPKPKKPDLKVLFFVCKTDTPDVPSRYPLGLLSLAGCVRSKEFLQKVARVTGKTDLPDSTDKYPDVEVKLIDMGLVPDNFDLNAAIAEFSPDIIGASATSASIDNAYQIAKTAAETCPSALRVIGGIHFTALPEEVLRNSLFEAGFFGEAEESFSELILNMHFKSKCDLSDISGVCYKDGNGQIQKTGWREPAIDLDAYPSIIDSYDIAEQYNLKNARLYMARGCPFNCPFCSRGIMRTGVRFRSPKKVVEDMRKLYEKGVREIYFIDDTFTLNRAKIIEFLEELKKSGFGHDIFWEMQTRVDSLLKDGKPDEELIKILAAFGCKSIQLGIETADPILAKSIKPGNNGDRAALVKALNKAGIEVTYNLMTGLPGQTWKSTARGLRQIFIEAITLGANFDKAGVGYCVPYPGNAYHKDGSVRLVKGEPGKNSYPVFVSVPLYQLASDTSNFEYGFKIPDLIPTETDVMTSLEISEAVFYYYMFIQAIDESNNQAIYAKTLPVWRELATRMAIDNIAEAKDSPSDITRNQKVANLRKKMLRGDFPEEFPGQDISMFLDMLINMTIMNGYEQLSELDHQSLYKFLSALYAMWMAAPGSFDKVSIVADASVAKDDLHNRLKQAPEAMDILKSALTRRDSQVGLSLDGLEITLHPENKLLSVSISNDPIKAATFTLSVFQQLDTSA